MRRYEGMDDLLRQVQDRMQANEGAENQSAPTRAPEAEEPYTSILNGILVLFHDAEQLRDLLKSDRLSTLSDRQSGDLLDVMEKVLNAVGICEEMLQATHHPPM